MDITPVLIRCREWREHIQSPIPTILQKLPEITGDDRLKGLNEALLPLFKKGRILLLVDGLDEIHNDAHRSIFVEHLEAFIEEHKLTRLVVTSREAGFSLVAPCIARFCERWRVAPLEGNAITALCDHWQGLMAGDSPQAKAEGREVAQYLLGNASLRRLAENPLLLTMLLVVKHGAGRLPPDRVSLYSRAVEVLLDTWNIKGHDPLNPKEAVPQLACVAFEMMRAGKQTATEQNLLKLLEEAREKVPQIRRYAKDTPHEFLKRVELRSSLLVEAGHQAEAGQTVPFYQFRHLTFQEYLAAVAAAEGHYMEYDKNDTVLTPLAPYLTAEEWKEVVPMAAVLARKQAEPLIAALLEETRRLRENVDDGKQLLNEDRWRIASDRPKLLPPVARLVQCLVEEAEAAPETLTAALQLIAFFAQGCSSGEDWVALTRGPYGAELLHQAWLLYSAMLWPRATDLLTTCSFLARSRQPLRYWNSTEGRSELKQLLGSKIPEDIARGLFTCAGLLWNPPRHDSPEDNSLALDIIVTLMAGIERHLFDDDPPLHVPAAQLLALIWHRRKKMAHPSPAILNRLLILRLHSTHGDGVLWSGIALSAIYGLARRAWVPTLTEEEVRQIRQSVDERRNTKQFEPYTTIGDLVVAFHAKTIWSEHELAQRLATVRRSSGDLGKTFTDNMLRRIGAVGQKYLKARKSLPRVRK
ncbi:MAG: hypothetical protein LLG97_02900 [Deltaproteobacteria bacterium]|nr:hypothetical protein [Deltaproteobacteria bacterium]